MRAYTQYLSRLIPLSLALSLAVSGCKNSEGRSSGLDKASLGGSRGLADSNTICSSDKDCDDGRFCSGVETCVEQSCVSGKPVACDDSIECTVDRCDDDEEECKYEAPDADFDGYRDSSCVDEGGAPLGDDCDDSDPLVFPGNLEICDQDNRDEDCNPSTIGELDEDRDGYNSGGCCNLQSDGDLLCGEDCDDKKTNVNPQATEACDFLDNNCNGETDEGVSIQVYTDADHDGRGDDNTPTVASCPGAVGFASIAGDCDDSDPEIFTGQFEICDGKDNNCNGIPDEVRESAPWFADVDEDGYGDPESSPIFSCYPIPGRVLSQNDCNDQENLVNPNSPEICDGLDNDCDGKANFKLSGANNFEDDDGDGVADIDCGGDDCNDEDARTAGGAEEVCDRVDNDCDGEVDEQTVQNIWYTDQDGDGWGVILGSAVASCDPVSGRATQFGDCDDSNQSIKPGVVEMCDGIDQDCDGIVDEGASAYCNLTNAISTCSLGNCRIYSCLPGFKDADNNGATGCEAALAPGERDTGIACTIDSECNDNNFCTGIETCEANECRLGTPINCAGSTAIVQGNVTINSGQDLLALQGVEIITGDVSIDSSFVTSLIGLESLTIIGGNLLIRNNTNLGRLSGSALSGLETVGGVLEVSGNDNLFNADLPSLTSVGSLYIKDNPALESIDGYDQLTTVENLLDISSNEQLTSIAGFTSLVRVGGQYDPSGGSEYPDDFPGGGPSIDSNEESSGVPPMAADLGFGPYSACANGGLILQDLAVVESIEAFSALQVVEGDLCLTGAPLLTELSFPQLTDVGVTLSLLEISALSTIDFPLLGDVGSSIEIFQTFGLEASDNLDLQELILPSLTSVGSFHLSGHFFGLSTIELNALEEVGDLMIASEVTAENAITTLEFDALVSASFIDIAYRSPAGLPELLFPLLTDIECGMSVATLSSSDSNDPPSGLLGTLELPGLKSIGRGENCLISPPNLETSGDTIDGPNLLEAPLNGFFFSADTGSASIIRLPELEDASLVVVQLQNQYTSVAPELALLDISSGVSATQAPVIDSLDINGNIIAVNIANIVSVSDSLALCVEGFDICTDYESIRDASEADLPFDDTTDEDCEDICNLNGAGGSGGSGGSGSEGDGTTID